MNYHLITFEEWQQKIYAGIIPNPGLELRTPRATQQERARRLGIYLPYRSKRMREIRAGRAKMGRRNRNL